MGHQTQTDGRYADTQELILHPSAERAATGTTSAVELGDRATGRFTLDVTAGSGTDETLDVVVQGSRDGSTNWYTLGTFAQCTGVVARRLACPLERFVRLSYTIGGTDSPKFTFDVRGETV
jgi:hypothetical protein